MGESRGGEGRRPRPTTTDIARFLLAQAKSQGEDVDQLTVQFATGSLYAVSVTYRGADESETYFISVADPSPVREGFPPKGGSNTDVRGESA